MNSGADSAVTLAWNLDLTLQGEQWSELWSAPWSELWNGLWSGSGVNSGEDSGVTLE